MNIEKEGRKEEKGKGEKKEGKKEGWFFIFLFFRS